MDLPAELRLTIFDCLDFKSLIRIAKSHPSNRDLVGRVFGSKSLEIRSEVLKISKTSLKLNVRDDMEDILYFMQHFGHCVTKLTVDYDYRIDRTTSDLLNKRISEYVAGFITEIDLHLNFEKVNGTMRDLIVSFPNVKWVTLQSGEIDVATLHEMFPAMRSLVLKDIAMTESLDHFPHLLHFAPPVAWGYPSTIAFVKNLNQTLRMNPQMKSLTLSICYWNLVEMLASVRPDLESLEILNFYYETHRYAEYGSQLTEHKGGPIEFKKMRKFKFGLESNSFAWNKIPTKMLEQNPFVFGNLEEIEFIGREGASNWVRVMLENRNLKKVIANVMLNDQQLQQIANGLVKLEEFTMEYSKDDTFLLDDIVQFMQTAKQLNKASFVKINKTNCATIADQISNEWINIRCNQRVCSFTRKHFDWY